MSVRIRHVVICDEVALVSEMSDSVVENRLRCWLYTAVTFMGSSPKELRSQHLLLVASLCKLRVK